MTSWIDTCRRLNIPPTREVLLVSTAEQAVLLLRRQNRMAGGFPFYTTDRRYRVSTSSRGAGQRINSFQTPLGLHHVASKIGGGQIRGTVFRGRQPVGLTWKGNLDAKIAHRILWLAGLEPGINQGGHVDSFARYIYIHGVGCERGLGRPASSGCVHMAADDLIPLFDELPIGTLVWIGEFPLLQMPALA